MEYGSDEGGSFKVAHGEWIYMCHINWFGYLCEHASELIPLTTLEIISKNSKVARADKPGLPLFLSENACTLVGSLYNISKSML